MRWNAADLYETAHEQRCAECGGFNVVNSCGQVESPCDCGDDEE